MSVCQPRNIDRHSVVALEAFAGFTRQEVTEAPFWDSFALKNSASLEEVQQKAAANKEFALGQVVMRHGALDLELSSVAEASRPALRVFSMGFRYESRTLPPTLVNPLCEVVSFI